jgi:hypothetical protein
MQNWFHWFTEWVKDFTRKIRNPAECKLVVLETLKSREELSVARSVRRSTPGAVTTWYITHQEYPNAHLIVALDNIWELKKFLGEPLPTDSSNVTRTHLVSVQWLIKVGHHRKRVYKLKGAWLADLQGQTNSINAKAGDVVRYLTLELLNLPGVPGISWESRIDRYNWEEALISKCRIISENHKPYLQKVRRADIVGSNEI